MKRLTLLLIIFLTSFHLHAQESVAPYLYYYLDDEGILVIERADGTDRRTIETNGSVQWSPSGQWMAAANQVISADGQTVIDLPEDANYMYWSPTEDILLTVSYFSNNQGLKGAILHLFDVPRNEELLYLDLDLLPDAPADFELSSIRWTSDGSFVSFYYYYAAYPESGFELHNYFYTISHYGAVEQEPVVNVGGIFRAFPLISSLGWIVHLEREPQALLNGRNLISRQEFQIPLTEKMNILYISWSPNGQDAFVFMRPSKCSDCNVGYDLWLLSTKSQSLTFVQSSVQIQWDNDATAGAEIEGIFWSPDGNLGAFTNLNEQLLLFKLDTRQLTTLAVMHRYNYLPWQWSGDSRYILFHDETLKLFDTNIAEYRVTNIAGVQSDFVFSGTSPNGRYIAFQTWGEPPRVYDIEEDSIFQLEPHSETTKQGAGDFIAYYEWSNDSQWLITSEIVFYAGGGNGPQAITVSKIDGSDFRELTYSWSQVHWLPEQVIPYFAVSE